MSDVMIGVPPQAPAPATARRAEGAFGGTVAESLALAVAPTTGRFRPQAIGDYMEEGSLLGHVTGGRGRADDVRMPTDGVVRSLLVRPGQLVRAGEALAWLERAGQATA